MIARASAGVAAGRRVPLARPARAQLLAAAVVAGALAVGAAVGVAGERVRANRAQREAPPRWVDAFAEELALTPAQRAGVDAVLAEREHAIDALVAPVRPGIDAARARARGQIRAGLTPGQQARFDAYLARMEAERARARPPGTSAR